jgi:hypothetical protein
MERNKEPLDRKTQKSHRSPYIISTQHLIWLEKEVHKKHIELWNSL